MDFSLLDFFIFLGSTLLLALLLMEIFDWSCLLSALDCPTSKLSVQFVYGKSCRPSIWRKCYPEARGRRQSPINIIGRDSTVLTPVEPLRWHGYYDEPISLSLFNDGNSVNLFGYWACAIRPSIVGGPLNESYDFFTAIFRWGPSDDEGSEHSIDYIRYALELQVVHLKRGIDTPEVAFKGRICNAFAIVSYFFQITPVGNPYLDHLITNLWRVSRPGSYAQIPSFPLEWLFPSFEKKYYTYSGSLSQPPCTEIATWIIQPNSIAISASQVSEFRKICSTEGPILSNTRPVQKLNDREVFYYS